MRLAPILRAVASVGLAGLAWITSGCTHHHYYGAGVPVACAEAPATIISSRYGEVCEVPAQSGGATVVTQAPAAAPRVVASAPRPSRVLVSEPRSSSPPVRGNGRFSWHRADPEGLATTRVDGALDDDPVSR